MSVQQSFTHRRLTRTVLVGLALAAATLSACAKPGPTGEGALGAATPTSGQPSPTTTTPATTPASTQVHTTPAGPSGPTIVVFKVKQQPACPIVGTSDAPFSQPGQDIVLQWQVSGGATGIALSIDDPAFFKTYHSGSYGNLGVSGTLDLAFNCDVTVQPNTTHTYTLNTIGGGASAGKTLTVTVQTSP